MQKSDSQKATEYFQSSRAAFQGGGVKGIALLGAYKAAVERGVNFSEVTGTSAGSIIAALIGAGASPEFIEKQVRSTNFGSFLAPPTREYQLKRRRWLSLVSNLSGAVGQGKARDLLKYGGLHSSKQIEDWMDGLLREVLGGSSGTVRFRDLVIETKIVAADLTNCQKKIWSKEKTPDDSVAFAVRCSCSIPGFFQPVSEGNLLYADGGMLSNLPAFVYAAGSSPAHQDRILAFRLSENRAHKGIDSIEDLSKRLIATVIDGAVELQGGLVQGVHDVSIELESIETTDFERVNKELIDYMLDKGYFCATEFFDDESTSVSLADNARRRELCRNDGDLYTQLIENLRPNIQQVLVAKKDTRWFWHCFPTFLMWRTNGIPVTVICEPSVDKREVQRREYMTQCGAQVEVMPNLPHESFIYLSKTPGSMLALTLLETESMDAPFATIYKGAYDAPAILSLARSLISEEALETANVTPVTLKAIDGSDVLQRLREGVGQYSSGAVDLELSTISTSDVLLLNRYVRAHKYRQIEHLWRLFKQSNVRPFGPAAVCMGDKTASVLTPPVIEEHNGRLITIEGNTRLYYCWRNGVDEVDAFVVSGVSDPLPGIPRIPSRVVVDAIPHYQEDRIEGFNYERFRAIERAARPLP